MYIYICIYMCDTHVCVFVYVFVCNLPLNLGYQKQSLFCFFLYVFFPPSIFRLLAEAEAPHQFIFRFPPFLFPFLLPSLSG